MSTLEQLDLFHPHYKDEVIIITHKNCWDGAAAAWAAGTHFLHANRPYQVFYCQYGDTPPSKEILSGKDVYILDFSFPKNVLLEIQRQARSLLVLDHHHTAKEDLEGMDCCTFDLSKAGCQLTWDHFFPGETPPPALAYVADRDLWKWEMPNSRLVAATLTGIDPTIYNLELYNESLNIVNFEDTVKKGADLLEFFERIYEKALTTAFYVDIDGVKVLFVQSAHVLSSELGSYVAERTASNISCVYSVGANGVTLSFRTVNGVDATPLAKKFGGGGHKTACGAKVDLDVFVGLVNQGRKQTFEVMP